MPTFLQRLEDACAKTNSLVCVGLDPDPERMPVADVAEFNRAIISATAEMAAAYKPNLAFYEALGWDGLKALETTVGYIHETAPHAIIIGDAKRGDGVPPSSQGYAKAMFQVWDFDAVTLNAWGGGENVAPFLDDPERGAFIWCRGSNPGSSELQDLTVATPSGPMPLYQHLATQARGWNGRGNLGLVVGATVPQQLAEVRQICPDMPLLVPGIGAQGGELEASVKAAVDAQGRLALINSSRGIIYASDGPDFAQAARREAAKLRDSINHILESEGLGWR